jgi:hypothetical protein
LLRRFTTGIANKKYKLNPFSPVNSIKIILAPQKTEKKLKIESGTAINTVIRLITELQIKKSEETLPSRLPLEPEYMPTISREVASL